MYENDVIASEPSDVGYMSKEQFESIIGGNVKSIEELNVILKALG